MSVSIEQIQPGAVFQFKKAPRRVTSLSQPLGNGFNVNWEYADGKRRAGRQSGTQWVHYFRVDAIEQIPDPSAAGRPRQIRPAGRSVPGLAKTVDILLKTHCPAKWAIVDMETGELWGHDGAQFRRLARAEAEEVAAVANQAVQAA